MNSLPFATNPNPAPNKNGVGYGGDSGGDWKARKKQQSQAKQREQAMWKEWCSELKSMIADRKRAPAVARKPDHGCATLKKVLRCQAPEWWWKEPHRGMYLLALRVSIQITTDDPSLWGNPDDAESVFCALNELAETSKMLIRRGNVTNPADSKTLEAWDQWAIEAMRQKRTNEKDLSLPQAISSIRDAIYGVVSSVVKKPDLCMITSQDFYRQALKPLAFATIEQFVLPRHHLQGQATQTQKRTSQKKGQYGSMKPAVHLWKELSSYPTALPIEYGSSICVRALENEMDKVRVLIIGPEGTPYTNGIFMFDVHMGNDYPFRPPSVKFLTTSNFLRSGSRKVRFNPNLYNDGKVCLSLLGTWSGPGWKPKESTLLQVLVSIQSLILGTSEPWFNEPGRESRTAQAFARQQSDKYNKELRRETLDVAILPLLKHHVLDWNKSSNPSRQGNQTYFGEFQEVIEQQFRLKKQDMKKQLHQWLREDQGLMTLVNDFNEVWRTIEEHTEVKAAMKVSSKRQRSKPLGAAKVAASNEVICLDGTDDATSGSRRSPKAARKHRATGQSPQRRAPAKASSEQDDVVDLT